MTAPVLFPQHAQQELERIVSRARQHPREVEHFFQLLPQGSRDLLAFSLFVTLVSAEEAP